MDSALETGLITNSRPIPAKSEVDGADVVGV